MVQVKISESKKELESLINKQKNQDNVLKLVAISYYNRVSNPDMEELCRCINKHPRTIYRWLKKYNEGGISNLLGT